MIIILNQDLGAEHAHYSYGAGHERQCYNRSSKGYITSVMLMFNFTELTLGLPLRGSIKATFTHGTDQVSQVAEDNM